MRFLTINPLYVLTEDGTALSPNKAMLPTGPLSIASALLAKEHEVEFLDLVPTKKGGQWGLIKAEIVLTHSKAEHILLCCHTARNLGPCPPSC